jgi:hypothetical protein
VAVLLMAEKVAVAVELVVFHIIQAKLSLLVTLIQLL